jgi:hypothetical protein
MNPQKSFNRNNSDANSQEEQSIGNNSNANPQEEQSIENDSMDAETLEVGPVDGNERSLNTTQPNYDDPFRIINTSTEPDPSDIPMTIGMNTNRGIITRIGDINPNTDNIPENIGAVSSQLTEEARASARMLGFQMERMIGRENHPPI